MKTNYLTASFLAFFFLVIIGSCKKESTDCNSNIDSEITNLKRVTSTSITGVLTSDRKYFYNDDQKLISYKNERQSVFTEVSYKYDPAGRVIMEIVQYPYLPDNYLPDTITYHYSGDTVIIYQTQFSEGSSFSNKILLNSNARAMWKESYNIDGQLIEKSINTWENANLVLTITEYPREDTIINNDTTKYDYFTEILNPAENLPTNYFRMSRNLIKTFWSTKRFSLNYTTELYSTIQNYPCKLKRANTIAEYDYY
jgi:YD repeat-containing protein